MYNSFGGGFFGGMPPFFMIIFLFIMGMIVFSIISGIKDYHKNASSPILTQHARIIAKRTDVRRRGSTSSRRTTTRYYATFETDAGQRIELKMSGREYGLLAEGDSGELTYQGATE
jgi:hypothetical protein